MYEEFRAIIVNQLPLIDEYLDDLGTPIRDRGLRAAIMFVDVCIVEIRNGTKDEFIKSEKFNEIVNVAVDWYYDKYGQLMKPKKECLSGIVRFYKQPVLLRIPVTTTKIEKEGETAWLMFPDQLQKDEDFKSLFVTNLSFDNLPEDVLNALRKEVEEIVALSRKTRISIMTSSVANGGALATMAASIWTHIEKAISDIISEVPANISLACWELHLAVEKSLKVYISQFDEEKGWGHDLMDLTKQAKKLGLTVDDTCIKKLHGAKDAIKIRYGEIEVTSKEAVESYFNVLNLVCTISLQFKREISIDNARILLKMAPWAR